MAIASAAADKKASDIVIIDMRKMSGICDYFVIASGTSTTQVRAIADHLRKTLREKGERLWHVEGEREASWVLMDFSDVVVHIFIDEMRRFYDLEQLWSDAPQVRYTEALKKIAPVKARRPKPKAKARSRKR